MKGIGGGENLHLASCRREKQEMKSTSLRIGIIEEAVYKGRIVTRSPLDEAIRDISRTHTTKEQFQNGEAPRPQGGELHGKDDRW